MKKKLALITTSVALAASGNLHAENQWGLTPYVGADVQSRHMNWGKGLGDNLFSHDAMQGNVYVGVKFNEHFGIEGGYESTAKKDRNVKTNPGDVITGVVSGNFVATYGSTTKFSGPHISLVGSVSISEINRLKLLGLIGVSSLKASLTRQRLTIANIPDNQPTVPFTARKNVLRLGAGLEHMLTDTWGVRGSLIWENANRLKISASNGFRGVAKPRNSLSYGLGAFISF